MKYNENGTIKEISVKASDTFPIGGTTTIPDDMPVPDGWEEVESNENILWTNPDATVNFDAQTITLNDDISNYRYYEVIYKWSVNRENYLSTGKIPSGKSCVLNLSLNINLYRLISSINGTSAVIDDNLQFTAYNGETQANNGAVIPCQIIGYK